MTDFSSFINFNALKNASTYFYWLCLFDSSFDKELLTTTTILKGIITTKCGTLGSAHVVWIPFVCDTSLGIKWTYDQCVTHHQIQQQHSQLTILLDVVKWISFPKCTSVLARSLCVIMIALKRTNQHGRTTRLFLLPHKKKDRKRKSNLFLNLRVKKPSQCSSIHWAMKKVDLNGIGLMNAMICRWHSRENCKKRFFYCSREL